MRWLYVPVLSSRNVQASPSYNFFVAFHRWVLDRDPEAVFYVVVPQVTPESGWKEGADWRLARTYPVEVPMYRNQFDDLILMTRDFWERFNERFGDLYFDVIVSEKPALTPFLRRLASFHMAGKSRKPLIVTRDQIILATRWFKIDPMDEAMQALGWAAAPVIFQSDHQAREALRVARKHLTPAHVRDLAEHMKVFPLGIDCADVDRQNMVERGQKNDEITVNYSHKLFLEQKFLESLKIMDSTLAGGRPIRLQIVTGSSPAKMQMMRRARKYQYIEMFGDQNRAQFLRQMARAHVFISNSYYEDFSATVAEQLYTGLVPVLLDADWSRYLVGDEYPYLFRSMDEGQAMLRYVVDHYAEIEAEWVPRLQARVRERFDLQRVIPEMVDWIRGLHEARVASLRPSAALEEVIGEAYGDLPHEFSLPEFYRAVQARADTLVITKEAESMSTSAWLCVDVLRRQHPDLVDLGGMQVRYRKAGA